MIVNDLSESWRTFDATPGMQCNQELARGPSVWYRVMGTGGVLTLSACDFSRQLDSGYNLYYAGEAGTCDTMGCMGGEFSTGTTCAFDLAGTITAFRSDLGSVYYIEVISYSPEPGFDQSQAGTNGLVRVRSAFG
jgi:hypothetical protein